MQLTFNQEEQLCLVKMAAVITWEIGSLWGNTVTRKDADSNIGDHKRAPGFRPGSLRVYDPHVVKLRLILPKAPTATADS